MLRRFPLPFAVVFLLAAAGSPAGAAVDPALLAGMKARSIGPAGMSGRIAVVEGLVSDPNVFYAGAATGGVWKSEDGGLTWRPIFDDQAVHAIGALAVNQKHPDIIWVGTGEGNIRNSVSIGNGVYKSLDGGRSWTWLGLPESERIHRIRLHPDDPNVAWVAVMGKLWGDSSERGVYKTTDGGQTWQRQLFVNERTGCADLDIDPANPDKLFAAMYDFRRQPGFFESGGRGSGLYVTHDGGRNWKKLTPDDGLPEGKLGRIGVAIAPSDPRNVYAFVEATENGIYRSQDGGRSWKNTGAKSNFGNRPFYYADLRVDPDYPDRVYSLWSMVSVSDDGGANWRTLIGWSSLHPDHHAMWIHPGDGRFLIEGNDGGVGISTDRGETWRYISNLPVGQFYHIAFDMDVPYHVYGGLQDNGSWRGPGASFDDGGLRNFEWQQVGWGDGFNTLPYPKDSRQGYSMGQEGYLMRWNVTTGERRSIRPAPDPGDTLRFNWNAGLAQDPFDPETIYYGSQYLHQSTDRGESWTRISGDLTTDNPAWQKQSQSGGLTPDVTGAENYTTIISIAPSRKAHGVIWVGTDDGRVQVTRDGGAGWTSVEKNAGGVPPNCWVPHINASPHDAATAFLVFDDHRRSNPKPYVYRLDDYGARWTSLVTPEIQGYCLTIEQDPVDPDLLFLGTEFGLYVSLDGGRRWMNWRHGLPTCSVMGLAIHPRDGDLAIGTHGRSAWILDDIRPLRAMNDDVAGQDLHLFDVPPAQQYRPGPAPGSPAPGATEFRGANRSYGALITFWVRGDSLPHPDEKVERERKEKERQAKLDKPEAPAVKTPPGQKPAAWAGRGAPEGAAAGPKIKVTIRNAAGKKIRKFERPIARGLNRIVWDLTSDPFKSAARSPGEWFEGGEGGPEVLPGDYEITLKYGDHEVKGGVTVLADPRVEYSAQDRQAAWEATQRAGRLEETVAAAAERLDATQKDLDYFSAKIRELKAARKKEAGADEDSVSVRPAVKDTLDNLAEEAGKLQQKVRELDKRLRRPRDTKGYDGATYIRSRIGEAQEYLSSTWDRPSPTVLKHLSEAEDLLRTFLTDFNQFYSAELAPFGDRIRALDLSILEAGKPVEMPK